MGSYDGAPLPHPLPETGRGVHGAVRDDPNPLREYWGGSGAEPDDLNLSANGRRCTAPSATTQPSREYGAGIARRRPRRPHPLRDTGEGVHAPIRETHPSRDTGEGRHGADRDDLTPRPTSFGIRRG